MHSANPKINYLIKNAAKHSSFAYSSAIARAKSSPIDELQRRIEKRLRPMFSADRFSQLQQELSSMPAGQRYDRLLDLQDSLNESGKA